MQFPLITACPVLYVFVSKCSLMNAFDCSEYELVVTRISRLLPRRLRLLGSLFKKSLQLTQVSLVNLQLRYGHGAPGAFSHLSRILIQIVRVLLAVCSVLQLLIEVLLVVHVMPPSIRPIARQDCLSLRVLA